MAKESGSWLMGSQPDGEDEAIIAWKPPIEPLIGCEVLVANMPPDRPTEVGCRQK